jgi:hypothetical protein
MPLQEDSKEKKAPAAKPEPLAVIGDALKAAGIAFTSLRKSDGVHDAVITVTVPKGG